MFDSRFACAKVLAIAGASLIACSSTPPSPPSPQQVVLKRQELKSYNEVRIAARNVALVLAEQLLSRRELTTVQLGPVVSADSGEIVRSGRDLQTLILLDMQSLLPAYSIKKLDSRDIGTAWFVNGVIRYEKPSKPSEDAWFKVEFGASTPDGQVMPVVPIRVNARQFDPTPSRFFQDAPIYLVDGHSRQRSTFSMTDGGQVSVETRNRFMHTEWALDSAISAYEAARFEQAERLFVQLNTISPGNLIALSGHYQSLVAQNRLQEAELALADVVDAGIQEKGLSFRLLFRVGSTEFRDDLDITSQYQLWLDVIGKRVAITRHCLKVVGHTSPTGSADYNDSLSLRRARRVGELLAATAPTVLKSRVTWEGAGSRKNIVGSGSDDAADSVDRRVDFLLHECR